MAFSKFSFGSSAQLICTRPTRNFSVFKMSISPLSMDARGYRNKRAIKNALHIQSTVHVQDVPGNVAGLFARQKSHRRSDIFRLANALQSDMADHVVPQLLR